MRTNRITLGFGRMSDDALEGFAASITASMTGNSNFPDVGTRLTTFNESSKAFSEALVESKTRHRTSVAVKNEKRAALEQQLRDMAHYCSTIASGERSILVSSGFSVNAEFSAVRPLSLPATVIVEPGINSGQVTMTAERVKSVRTYLFLYAPSPVEDDHWQHSMSVLPYCSINGLTPGKMYSFKLGVTGARGEVLYTEPFSKVVPW